MGELHNISCCKKIDKFLEIYEVKVVADEFR